MKKVLYSLLAGLLLIGPMSCKKDDPAGPALATAPEANAADDNKSGGVYKGALIGSSGTIKIVLQGGKKEIVLQIDGETRTLTTTSLDSWTSGQEIVDATFTSGDWSVMLSIVPDGSDGAIYFNIPGHTTINLVLLKEKSDQLIMAFEGTYAGTSSGTWNFIIQDGFVYGVTRDSDGVSTVFDGTINGATITVSLDNVNTDVVATGMVSGNTANGTWTNTMNTDVHGTWTGTRTL
jgi:hypothetical protein